MARNFSDMVADAIRKQIAEYKAEYGDEWVKELSEWTGPDGFVTIKMDGRSILQGDVFMNEQPAQPTRRLVKRWGIYRFKYRSLKANNYADEMIIANATDERQMPDMFGWFDSQENAEQALLIWGQEHGYAAEGDYVIVPVYRVETDSK